MSEQYRTLREYDAGLSLWWESPTDPEVKTVRDFIVRHLRDRGFRMRLDREVKRQFPILSKNHHEGFKGKLKLKIECSGRCLGIKFYQEVVTENRNGGYYDFDKFRKMPYLIRLSYILERNKLAEALTQVFMITFRPEVKLSGLDFIRQQQQELMQFQGPTFYTQKRPSYNTTGRGKITVVDGETYYFQGYDGRWRRGIAHYHINNMWWVLLPCGTVRNLGSLELGGRPETGELSGRNFAPKARLEKLQTAKKNFAANEQYEQAAACRNAIAALNSKVVAA